MRHCIWMGILVGVFAANSEVATCADKVAQTATPPPFSAVKPDLCTKSESDFLGRDCRESDYTAIPTDLNNDGQVEWVYLGKDRLCGASGNCTASVVQNVGTRWRLIWNEGGRILERLKSKHQGYADLLQYAHSSGCESVYSTYVWNGQRYRDTQTVTCDYCAEEDKGKKLPAVCHAKFKNALFCTICE